MTLPPMNYPSGMAGKSILTCHVHKGWIIYTIKEKSPPSGDHMIKEVRFIRL